MRHWNLHDVEASSPAVLHSRDGEGRVVLLALSEGDELGEHQVREGALVLVADGKIRVESGDESVDAGPGDLIYFEPQERRTVTATSAARVLLVLSPWPGEGHYAEGELLRTSA